MCDSWAAYKAQLLKIAENIITSADVKPDSITDLYQITCLLHNPPLEFFHEQGKSEWFDLAADELELALHYHAMSKKSGEQHLSIMAQEEIKHFEFLFQKVMDAKEREELQRMKEKTLAKMK